MSEFGWLLGTILRVALIFIGIWFVLREEWGWALACFAGILLMWPALEVAERTGPIADQSSERVEAAEDRKCRAGETLPRYLLRQFSHNV